MNILIIVDMQKEFKDTSTDYSKVLSYIFKHAKFYDMVYATVFSDGKCHSLTTRENPHLAVDADESSIEFMDIVDIVPMHFASGFNGNMRWCNKIDLGDHVTVIGCDTAHRIQSICFELWGSQVDFTVLSDYVYTGDKHFTNSQLAKLLKVNFGSCVT